MKRITVLLGFLVLLGLQVVFAQTKQITGTVTSAEDGMGIPGVSVVVKGTTIGVTTDIDGKYTLSNVPQNAEAIVFSFVGLKTVEMPANLSIINVIMESDSQELDEVVVTGYSSSTKRAFTGTATTVKAEKIAAKNVGDISKALVGEVPGVTVLNTSGQPGTVATIRIRGVGSINGNVDPLYVVDGVPFEGSITSINPNDIESTTILKDAAATAIYGARGANGVIVITTKRGRSGDAKIIVEQRYGQNMSFIPRYETIKSPEKYIALSWEALYNKAVATGEADPTAWANDNLFFTQEDIDNNGVQDGIFSHYNMWNVTNGSELIDPATRTVLPSATRRYNPENWEDYAFQASNRSETTVSISGGSDRSTYYTSFGYLKDVGYSINSDFERLNARLNGTYKPKKWLSGSMNVGYSLSNTKNSGQTTDSGSIFWFVDNIPSIYPLFLRDAAGNTIDDPYFPGRKVFDYGDNRRRFGALTNAISDATVDQRERKTHELSLNSAIKAEIIEGLTAEVTVASSYLNSNRIVQNSPFYGSSASSGGSIYRQNDEYFSYNFLQLLRYKKRFDQHNLEVFAAHEANYWQYGVFYASKSKLADPFGTELDNAIVSSSPAGSYKRDYTLESYFGQLNYDFENKYFLSATVRRDGSSRFLKNKWGTFGSIGAGWLVSSEDFLAENEIIRMLKLRTSFGTLGEQGGVGYYPGYDLYNVTNLNNNLSFTFDTKGNPDLTWESSSMFQVGFDASITRFIDLSVDYYIKNTTDLLFDRRVAPSNGYAIIKVNDGKLRNSGLEIDLTAHLLKTSEASIDFRINAELLKNELIDMPIEPSTGEQKIIDIAGNFGRTAGRSRYDYYMREYVGVDPTTGVSTWVAYFDDINEDGIKDANESFIASLHQYQKENPDKVGRIAKTTTTDYNSATRFFVGKSALPKVRGGFALMGTYKNFDFSMNFVYSLGGWGYDFTYAGLMGNRLPGGNNWHVDMLDAWKQEGDATDIPRLSADYDKNVTSASTRFLIKSSFLNLNNVRIGYTLPKRWVEKIGVGSINVHVSGDNLWLLSHRKGYNPSTSLVGETDTYTYSPLSTISGGIRITF